jgi:hypothetical protein
MQHDPEYRALAQYDTLSPAARRELSTYLRALWNSRTSSRSCTRMRRTPDVRKSSRLTRHAPLCSNAGDDRAR